MERHCFQQLPDGYEKTLTLDLQKDTKLALVVNGLAVGIAAVMLAAGFLLMPVFTIFASLPVLAAFLVCTVLYMVLHELVHGAGSSEYFKKVAYIVVALAPLVVWGAVFLALNLALGAKHFWFIYLLQLVNVSGAAGDLYVSFRFLRMPKDILVQDTGVSMTVFTRN